MRRFKSAGQRGEQSENLKNLAQIR
jgi:acyl-CoA reductase-like NAD-dependent aldehyde dehydrogenase